MVFKIKVGNAEFYPIRASLESVIKLAREKARHLPVDESVLIFRDGALIRRISRIDLYEGLEESGPS
jgi:hypothetical protein